MRLGYARISLLLGLICLLAGGLAARPAAAQSNAAATSSRTSALLVQLDLPPLALVGRGLSAAQRRAYAQTIAAAQDEAARAVAALGGKVVRRFSLLTSGLLVQLPTSGVPQLAQAAGGLKLRPVADYALSEEPGPPAKAAAQQALALDGRGTSIAVIDSGIDYTHQAFGGPGTVAAYQQAIAANATISDSLYFPGPRVKGGYDYVGETWPNGDLAPDPNPIDAEGHGTAVADIAAGSAPGAPGVAPAADIYAFKACSAHSRKCSGPAILQAIEDALDLDRDLGTYDPATVIVLALSSAYGQPEDDLSYYVNIAADYGVIVVTSAGNSGDKPYNVGAPSTAIGAISVGQSQAASGQPTIAADASRGPRINDGMIKPDLVAPGGSMAALVGSGSGRATFSGASSAAPLVAGAAALLAQKYGSTLTPAAYRALLMNSANPSVAIAGAAQPAEPAALGLRGIAINAALGSSSFAPAPRLVVTCADGRLQVLDPSADTFVEEAQPSARFGDFNYLRVRDARKLAGEMITLLRFPAPSCAPTTAQLQVDVNRFYPPIGGRLLAFGVSSRWSERTSWNERPRVGAPSGSVAVTTTGSHSLDVTSLVRGGEINLALRSDGLLSIELRSREVNAPPRMLVSCTGGGARLLDVIADTFVRQDTPTTSWGAFTTVRVVDEAQSARIGLLRFPAPDCSPASAQLEFQVGRLFRPGTIEVNRIAGSWDETTTWNTRPELVSALSQVAVPRPGFYRVDVSGVFSGQANALAPITRQGAGQLDLDAAAAEQTLAWVDGATTSASPAYSQTASLSFGFLAANGQSQLARTVRVRNLGDSPHTYALRTAFRYADDLDKGVSIAVTPASLTVPARGEASFLVNLSIDSAQLRAWTLNAGSLGNAGSDFGSASLAAGPSLTLFEYDGFVTIDGGAQNQVRLPWQVLPRRSAELRPLSSTISLPAGGSSAVTLANLSAATAGEVEVFSLVEQSPNIYSYTVGSLLGQNYTLIDLKEVGVRGRTPSGGQPLVEFAATVHDQPYRAAQYPVQVSALIDADRDGSDDYQVFTDDAARDGSDGRSAVFVRRLPDGTPQQVGFVDRDFNSQNWILPVPAAAIGVTPGTPFSFQVLVSDNAFPPRDGEIYLDSSARLTYQVDAPAFVPAALSGQVALSSSATLSFSASPAGTIASPSQKGLLLLYRHAPVGRESDAIQITAS